MLMQRLTDKFALVVCLIFYSSGIFSETNTMQQQKFFEAVRSESVVTIQKMIADGFDIETRDDQGRTALLLATQLNEIEIAKALIKAEADVNAKDNIEDSPFLYAGAEGRLEILRMTLKHGADLTSVNRYGGTALIPAAHHGHVETVRELLKTDIDIDHVNNLGWTALLETVILGNGGSTYIEIARLLIEAGADVTISDNQGVTPLQHARARGYHEIARLIEAAT